MEENEDSKIVYFWLEVTLNWYQDENGQIIFEPKLKCKFIVVDEESKVVGEVVVEDNIQTQ